MTGPLDGRTIRAVDLNADEFRKAWSKLPREVGADACESAIRALEVKP